MTLPHRDGYGVFDNGSFLLLLLFICFSLHVLSQTSMSVLITHVKTVDPV